MDIGQLTNDPIDEDIQFGEEDQDALEYHFEQGVFQYGAYDQWHGANRTLKFALSPADSEGIAWVDAREKSPQNPPVFDQDKKLYPTRIPRQVVSEHYAGLVFEMYNIQVEMERDQRTAKECLEQLIDLLANFTEPSDSQHELMVVDASYIVMLFDAVKFAPSDVHNITEQFLHWVNTVDAGWSAEDTQEVMSTTPPTAHPAYWRYVHHATLRGIDDVCIATIRGALTDTSLPPDVREILELAIQLFRSYPEGDHHSKYTFRQWREACLDARNKARDIQEITFRLEICKMLDIMSGQFEAIIDTADQWYEAVGAMLKYHDPMRSRLQEYYNMVKVQLPIDTTTEWEVGCAAIIADDLLQAVLQLEKLDIGVAATMSSFCLARGLFEHYFAVTRWDSGIPDWLSITHAQRCLGTSNLELTKVGIEMLQMNGTREALDCLAEVLPRIDWKSAADLDWATQLASQLGLKQAAQAIHKSSANAFFSAEHYYDAFIGLAQAGDVQGLTDQCWKLFEKMLVDLSTPTDPITAEALAENSDIDRSSLVRECMAPCAVLNGYLTNLKAANPSTAAKYVVALFKFPFMQPKYKALLVAITMPLLSSTTIPVFKYSDLVEIMTVLNNWEDLDDAVQKDALHLLTSSLSTAPTTCKGYDWRKEFANSTINNGSEILHAARVALSREVARCYLS